MNSAAKRRCAADSDDEDGETLLPGLPNHLAHLCLSSLCPSLLRGVCRSWRRLIYSPYFPPFFSLYALLSPSPRQETTSSLQFFYLDPFSLVWRPLPSPPSDRPVHHLLHRHSSFLSRKLPMQSLVVSGHLALISGTNHRFLPGLSDPLIFHPQSNRWFSGPPFAVPRRWCATGSAGNSIFVASGVGSHYQGDVARSVEQWDLGKKKEEWKWEKRKDLKDSRFSREAVEAVGYRGKLCMVNVKGNAPKDGAVYDVENDSWDSMPEGMVAGWNGPAAAAKEEELYSVDEIKGVLGRYDAVRDCWDGVVESALLKGAQQMDAGRGRVCVVCGNGKKIAVVDVASPATKGKIWVVEPPLGYEVVAVHILPRMSVASGDDVLN